MFAGCWVDSYVYTFVSCSRRHHRPPPCLNKPTNPPHTRHPRSLDARDQEIARLATRLEEAVGVSSTTSTSAAPDASSDATGAKAANARIIAQLHKQVDFLSRELAGREAEVKALRAREASGGREACRALQVGAVWVCVAGVYCLKAFGGACASSYLRRQTNQNNHQYQHYTICSQAEVTSLTREKGRLLDRVAALEGRLTRAEEGLEEEGQRREVGPCHFGGVAGVGVGWWMGMGGLVCWCEVGPVAYPIPTLCKQTQAAEAAAGGVDFKQRAAQYKALLEKSKVCR